VPGIVIHHKIGMTRNYNDESIQIDSTDCDSISVEITNRLGITIGESIRKATRATLELQVSLSGIQTLPSSPGPLVAVTI
jgi:hypothetical protein